MFVIKGFVCVEIFYRLDLFKIVWKEFLICYNIYNDSLIYEFRFWFFVLLNIIIFFKYIKKCNVKVEKLFDGWNV